MSDPIAICTLFEGDYHYGVGPLVNSLYENEFRGVIWAGYRGALPPWATPLLKTAEYAEYQVASGCVIRFVPVEITAHLTNYKPDFMLSLLAGHAQDYRGIFYFDPDIVVCHPWHFFEEWITCGVAVCEDINSPFALQHPRRVGWRRFFGGFGLQLQPKEACYANGGFIGIRREDIAFLKVWKSLQDHMWSAVGGPEFAGISGGQTLPERSGFANCFDKTDQDALNAAIEVVEEIPASFANRQAMGFEAGRALLPHALGPVKPWKKQYLRDALRGLPPRAVDKEYWLNTQGPIRVFTPRQCQIQRLLMQIATAIGRFIRRS